MRLASRAERGFSLIELMVAMLITMIISGAIYGLMAGGQTAFRREPELADRQQNIRVAMDMIMRDIANAGSGMPAFMQTFTRSLNAPSGAPTGLDGQGTDELEIMTNNSSRDNEVTCADLGNAANSNNLRTVMPTTNVKAGEPVLIVFDDGTWTFRAMVGNPNPNSGSAERCAQGSQHAQLNFNQGNNDTSGMNTSGGFCKPSANGIGNAGSTADGGSSTTACPSNASEGPPCCMVREISFAEIVRYRIRNDATTGTPVLQRSTTANLGVWDVVANGIEDLQVEYTQGNGTRTAGAPGAPQVVLNDYGTIITQVEVTLASRSEAQNIQGMTTNSSGPTRIRGRLTATGSPRSSLIVLSQQPTGTPTWQ